jgi:hypothetical protein
MAAYYRQSWLGRGVSGKWMRPAEPVEWREVAGKWMQPAEPVEWRGCAGERFTGRGG